FPFHESARTLISGGHGLGKGVRIGLPSEWVGMLLAAKSTSIPGWVSTTKYFGAGFVLRSLALISAIGISVTRPIGAPMERRDSSTLSLIKKLGDPPPWPNKSGHLFPPGSIIRPGEVGFIFQ